MSREVKFLNLKGGFSQTKRCALIAKRGFAPLMAIICSDGGLIESCDKLHPATPGVLRICHSKLAKCGKPLNLFTPPSDLTA